MLINVFPVNRYLESQNSSILMVYDQARTWNAVAFLTIVICIIGLYGNGKLIHFLIFHIKQKQVAVYSLSLAVVDTIYLFGCLVFIILCLCLLSTERYFLYEIYLLVVVSYFLNNLLFNCSLFLLVALSTDRCVSVWFPIWYRCKRPQHLSSINCGVMWVLSLLITALERFPSYEHQQLIYVFISILYTIFSLIMVFSSVVLLNEIQKSSVRFIKLYIVIVATVFYFYLSLASVQVVVILSFLKFISFNFNVRTFIFFNCMCSAINSCSNPYIYILVGRWRKKSSIMEALELVFKEEVEQLETISA